MISAGNTKTSEIIYSQHSWHSRILWYKVLHPAKVTHHNYLVPNWVAHIPFSSRFTSSQQFSTNLRMPLPVKISHVKFAQKKSQQELSKRVHGKYNGLFSEVVAWMSNATQVFQNAYYAKHFDESHRILWKEQGENSSNMLLRRTHGVLCGQFHILALCHLSSLRFGGRTKLLYTIEHVKCKVMKRQNFDSAAQFHIMIFWTICWLWYTFFLNENKNRCSDQASFFSVQVFLYESGLLWQTDH